MKFYKVLIAESSAPDRLILESILSVAGHTPVCVENGIEVIQAFKDESPDLIFMETFLPGISGIELAKSIRQLQIDKYAPIILLATNSDSESISSYINAGADDVVIKPYNRTLLELKIQSILRIVENANSIMAGNFIEKSIEFDHEYRQAGISILSFFSEIVDVEFPRQDVKVGIIQKGNSVTLRIETPDGVILKEVEQKLNEYGMAVMGKQPIESLSGDRNLIRELKTRLEVSGLELKLRQEAHLEYKVEIQNTVENLQSQILSLHEIVGQSLIHQKSLAETIIALSNNNDPSNIFKIALESISDICNLDQSTENEKKLKYSLSTIEKESPGLLIRLAQTLEGIPASIAAGILTPWVQAVIVSIPK